MRLLAALLLLSLAPAARALTDAALAAVVKEVDERQRNQGDWKALAYMEQKEKGKTDVVYELLVYRRDEDDKQMFLFTKPRSEAGKGYLRIEKNLWLYDPSTGRWERRTERERIGGTNTRRGDLDESRLVEEYDAKWEADEKLGVYAVHRVLLTAKAGVDVAFPVVRLWIDEATTNVLKRQELALSGRLMRTV
jgi:outer membrane lipoprotein-sorting protein